MAESRKIKNMVIFTLLVSIVIMVTAIVVLAYNNDYTIGTSGNKENFRVEFTDIYEHEIRGNVKSKFQPYFVGTNAYFQIDFVAPGDFITYVIEVTNFGKIDAELEDIIYVTDPNRDVIKYEVWGIKEGSVLKAGKSYEFKVRVYYETYSSDAEEFDKPIQIKFNFEQDD